MRIPMPGHQGLLLALWHHGLYGQHITHVTLYRLPKTDPPRGHRRNAGVVIHITHVGKQNSVWLGAHGSRVGTHWASPVPGSPEPPGSCLLSQEQMDGGSHKGAVWHACCSSHGKPRPCVFLITPGVLFFLWHECRRAGPFLPSCSPLPLPPRVPIWSPSHKQGHWA